MNKNLQPNETAVSRFRDMEAEIISDWESYNKTFLLTTGYQAENLTRKWWIKRFEQELSLAVEEALGRVEKSVQSAKESCGHKDDIDYTHGYNHGLDIATEIIKKHKKII